MPHVVTNINCLGNEANLLGCSHSIVRNSSCSSNRFAGLSCGGIIYICNRIKRVHFTCSISSILVPCVENSTRQFSHTTSSRSMVVEICRNGHYTTICGQNWGNEEASVVCGELGFSPAGASFSTLICVNSFYP